MPLTKEQIDKLQHYLSGQKGCLRCGAQDLTPGEIIGLNPPNTLGGQHVPCVVLACGNCGHIELISAKLAGLA